MKARDLTNMQFGRLTAIEYAGGSKWLCKCSCGNEKLIKAILLVKGKTRSCGCLHKEIAKNTAKKMGESRKKHGMSNTRLYRIWQGIKERTNPNCKDSGAYKYYISKGIKVCEEWLNFENFFLWAITHGYNDSLTIDRIDGDKDYEPSNCRWVTMQVQRENISNTSIKRKQKEKERKLLLEICEIYGVRCDI